MTSTFILRPFPLLDQWEESLRSRHHEAHPGECNKHWNVEVPNLEAAVTVPLCPKEQKMGRGRSSTGQRRCSVEPKPDHLGRQGSGSDLHSKRRAASLDQPSSTLAPNYWPHKVGSAGILCEVNDEGTPTLRAPQWQGKGNGLFGKQRFTCWIIWCCQVELVDLCPKGQSHPTPSDKLKPFWDSWRSNMEMKTPGRTVSISGH